jgi:hypothetical protein
MLDIGTNVVLDPPDRSKGDNPDVLVTLDGKRWGFAGKTSYGASAKALFDNLKKGVDQIQRSPAEIGCVGVNLRRFIDLDVYWSVVNAAEYKAGGEPIFAAFSEPELIAEARIEALVTTRRDQVVKEIGYEHVLNIFKGKKALPAFAAYLQAATGKETRLGPMPTSITKLSLGTFGNIQDHIPLFEKINKALHEQK